MKEKTNKMKKLFLSIALCLFTYAGFAQCRFKGYEVKAENAYTNYNVRWATGPEDAKHYTTNRLRKEYLIEKVFAPGEVNWTYTLYDRFLIGGAEPTTTPLKLTSINYQRRLSVFLADIQEEICFGSTCRIFSLLGPYSPLLSCKYSEKPAKGCDKDRVL